MDKDTCLTTHCNAKAAKKGSGYCGECWGVILDARFGNLAWTRVGTREKAIQTFWDNVKTGDGCWGWRGATANGYGRVSLNGKNIQAHRFSYELAHGPISEGMMIDHKCHNRECTNPEHLREVTPQQNSQHRIGKNPNNTSGRHGVSWRKDIQKWHVVIHSGDKGYHVGYFTDLDEAAEAARLKRNELFTHNDKDRRAA